MNLTEQDIQRYWAQVEKTDECWLWQGSVNNTTGNGRMSCGGGRPDVQRIAYFLAYGIDANARVIRKCKNHLCVRPEHLFLYGVAVRTVEQVDHVAGCKCDGRFCGGCQDLLCVLKFGNTGHQCRKCVNVRGRNWRKTHSDRARESSRVKQLRVNFDLTRQEYNEMFAAQNGLCAICHKPETAKIYGRIKELHVDHDHNTGQVRSLLCGRCNTRLGFIENVEAQKPFKEYLQQHKTPHTGTPGDLAKFLGVA